MLDFGGLGKSAEQMAQAATDIVEKLDNIERLQRINNVLLAMLISDSYAAKTGFPADIEGVLEQAKEGIT